MQYDDIQFTNSQNQQQNMQSQNQQSQAPDMGTPNMKNGSYAGMASQPPKKTSYMWLIILIIIVVVIGLILSAVFAVLLSKNSSTSFQYGSGNDYIGVLYAEGTIQSSSASSSNDSYQQDWLLDQIDSMINDSSNKGIMLYVNSPGGAVYQADELYLKLKEYQETTKRPLHAYFGETAASGGYYIAANADKISANRNSTTGSVGVYVGPLIDASELLSKLGIKTEIVKSGSNKAMGNNYTPLTEEQKSIYQSVVDESYDQFVDVVVEGRSMKKDEVEKIADGRVYTAAQAQKNGLIDEVCTFEEAKDNMLEECDLSCTFNDIKYIPQSSIYDMLFSMQSTIKEAAADRNKSEAQLALEMLEEQNNFTVSYLMQ